MKASRVRDLPLDVVNATAVKAGAFNAFKNSAYIKGEVVDSGHMARLERLSYSFGSRNAVVCRPPLPARVVAATRERRLANP